MAKNAPTLDTPFRRGEKVLTTRDLDGRPDGTRGKVKLVNGLQAGWMRYWVRFDDGELVGHVDHDDLVRPTQLQDWKDRAEAEAEAARKAEESGAEAAAAPAPEGGGGDGVASQIPAALLERSKAAKARLLGG